jgi:hypothetical protein
MRLRSFIALAVTLVCLAMAVVYNPSLSNALI